MRFEEQFTLRQFRQLCSREITLKALLMVFYNGRMFGWLFLVIIHHNYPLHDRPDWIQRLKLIFCKVPY